MPDRRPNTTPQHYEILLLGCAYCGKQRFYCSPLEPPVLGVFCGERCLIDKRRAFRGWA